MSTATIEPRNASPVPLVDLVTHARGRHRASPRGDLVESAVIYAAALLATAGFVIASVVDEVLAPVRRGARGRGARRTRS